MGLPKGLEHSLLPYVCHLYKMTAATDGEGKGPQRQQVVAGSLAHGSHEKMIIVLDDKNKTDLEFLTKLPSNGKCSFFPFLC